MSKYQTLVNVLDQLRKEAPLAYKGYHPLETEVEKINKARSRAFIHLYLKVKFGLLNFIDRESYVTDGSHDGGVDAYYIDENNRTIYLIQSKFRTNEKNFQNKDIELHGLLNMDVGRITKGETYDENGNKYNDKIQALIRKIQDIRDIGRYDYEVIILANVTKLKSSDLQKLVPGFPCMVIDFSQCYKELVFPVVSGTYYQASNLFININLADKESSGSRIRYPVQTKSVECEITVLFVPTIEIAKNFHKFKNSILKYNPRSYLDLSRNPVNREITRTIRERNTNEFSLFNNGITILSDDTKIQERAGRKGWGQLTVTNPQIINGGQTAYTLSIIYETVLFNSEDLEKIFGNKEVMLKVITFPDRDKLDEASVLDLITEISRATNSQTSVKESDRRANDTNQIELQQKIFNEFGYFYERKRGEFYDGLKNKYIDKSKIIDRQSLLRACYSIVGYPAEAARISENELFRKSTFYKILSNIHQTSHMFFAFLSYKKLIGMRKKLKYELNNRFGILNYGNALEHGILAVTFVANSLLDTEVTSSNVASLVDDTVTTLLGKWLEFEEFAKDQSRNTNYFRRIEDLEKGSKTLTADFFNYYRGQTLKGDLVEFFKLDR